MTLGKNAVFSALLHNPGLAIHLLKVVTDRLLQNAGIHDNQLKPLAELPEPAPRRGFSYRLGRKSRMALIVALTAIPVGVAIYQPLYIVLDRDAAVTSWLNVATASIAGTIEGFDTRVGQQVGAQATSPRSSITASIGAASLRRKAGSRRPRRGWRPSRGARSDGAPRGIP